jgi:hypothetical protein
MAALVQPASTEENICTATTSPVECSGGGSLGDAASGPPPAPGGCGVLSVLPAMLLLLLAWGTGALPPGSSAQMSFW